MSVGSWLLSITATSTGVATAGELFGSFPRIAPYAHAAACGPPLATYTSVLIANSAIPVWHEARRELPRVAGQRRVQRGRGGADHHAEPPLRSGAAPGRHRRSDRGRGQRGNEAQAGRACGDLPQRRCRPLRAVVQEPHCDRRRNRWPPRTAALAAVLGGALVLAGSVLRRWSVSGPAFNQPLIRSRRSGPNDSDRPYQVDKGHDAHQIDQSCCLRAYETQRTHRRQAERAHADPALSRRHGRAAPRTSSQRRSRSRSSSTAGRWRSRCGPPCPG